MTRGILQSVCLTLSLAIVVLFPVYRSHVSATAGTVRNCAIVSAFHSHPRKSAFIATILLSEIRKNYKWPNVANKEDEGPELLN